MLVILHDYVLLYPGNKSAHENKPEENITIKDIYSFFKFSIHFYIVVFSIILASIFK